MQGGGEVLGLIIVWPLSLCVYMCVCVCMFYWFIHSPGGTISGSTCSSCIQRKDNQEQIKEHTHTSSVCVCVHYISMVLLQRMHGPHTNVAQGAFHMSNISPGVFSCLDLISSVVSVCVCGVPWQITKLLEWLYKLSFVSCCHSRDEFVVRP